jgi:hypothetical protein
MIDNSELYNTCLSTKNLDALSDQNILDILVNEQKNINSPDTEISQCTDIKQKIIAKKYSSLDKAYADNQINVFFDPEYDPTNYDIINKIQSNEFSDHNKMLNRLATVLQDKFQFPPETATLEASYIISHQRPVLHGHYAIVLSIDSIDDTNRSADAIYLKRNLSNNWIIQENMPDSDFINEPEIICNLNKECVYSNNGCISHNAEKNLIYERELKKIIGEFDSNGYNNIQSHLIQQNATNLNFYTNTILLKTELQENYNYKQNSYLYILGDRNKTSEHDPVRSPHIPLLNSILSHNDFKEKQNYILTFVDKCTIQLINAESTGSTDSSEHWLYCNETKQKLLPKFIYTLAYTFINGGPDKYLKEIDTLADTIGVMSDDGSEIVDSHSGYTIKDLNFQDQVEYSESGFKQITHDTLPIEFNRETTDSNAPLATYTPQQILILNVVKSLSDNLSIDMSHYYDFVVKQSEIILNKNETLLKRHQQRSKGKKTVDVKQSFLLKLIICLLHAAVQTSIPNIRTRKTFPNCVRSFSGFPIDSPDFPAFSSFDDTSDDMLSSIVYFACVAKSTATNNSPWNTIKKKTINAITHDLYSFYINFVLTDVAVKQKFVDKLDWLNTDEAELQNDFQQLNPGWDNFLPPIRPITLSDNQTSNISSSFNNSLTHSLKNALPKQSNQILLLKTKILFNTLDIQTKIKTIIDDQDPVLSNMYNEPFVENACCQGNYSINATEYFFNLDPNILNNNIIIHKYEKILKNIKSLSSAQIYHSITNTRVQLITEPIDFADSTRYKLLIQNCNFFNHTPIPTAFNAICSDKPEQLLSKTDSIQSHIAYLHSQSIYFTNSDANNMIKIINNNNKIIQAVTCDFGSEIIRINKYLDNVDSTIFPNEFITTFKSIIDSYDVTVTNNDKSCSNFYNYIRTLNDKYFKEIHKFFTSHYKSIRLSSSKTKKLLGFIKTITEWNDEKYINQNSLTFMKNILNYMCIVFPEIILRSHKNKDEIPQHWKLSERHNMKIKEYINDFYSGLGDLFDIPLITNLITNIQPKLRKIYELLELIPLNKNLATNIQPLFSPKIVKNLMRYFFFHIIKLYIDSDMSTMQSENVIAESITHVELHAIAGDTQEVSHIKLKSLVKIITIFMTYKKTIYYSAESINEKNIKSKETEKNKMTNFLEKLNNEEREIEKIFKANKLGMWGVGLEKGMTQYVKETYDAEITEIDGINRELTEDDMAEIADDHEANDITDVLDDDDSGEMDSDQNFW